MLESCADLAQSYIAQRVFEECFPRLSYRPVTREDWKNGEDAVLIALVSLMTSNPNREAQLITARI